MFTVEIGGCEINGFNIAELVRVENVEIWVIEILS